MGTEAYFHLPPRPNRQSTISQVSSMGRQQYHEEKDESLESPQSPLSEAMETARLIDESTPSTRWSTIIRSPDGEEAAAVLQSRTRRRHPHRKQGHGNRNHTFWLLHGTLLLLSSFLAVTGITCLAFSSSSLPCRSSTSTQQEDSAEVMWSPVLDHIPARKTRFNETFKYPTKYPSAFSHGLASETEWRKWTAHPMLSGQNGTVAVSEDVVSRIAQSHGPEWKESVVQLSHNGETRYMGQIAMFHHLHCLNILRHAVHPEIYGRVAGGGHLDHCIESLREVLMCNPSGSEVILFHWMADSDEPYPDYNTWHMCRDPAAVLDWALDNAVAVRGPLRKPHWDRKGEELFVLDKVPY